jgi:hypothetical protein
MPRSTYPASFDNSNDIWRRVQIRLTEKLIIKPVHTIQNKVVQEHQIQPPV